MRQEADAAHGIKVFAVVVVEGLPAAMARFHQLVDVIDMRKLLLMLLCIMFALPALGSESKTVGFEFQPIKKAGKPHGCSLIYSILTTDTAYKQSGIIAIGGSISVHSFENKNMILSLKIGIGDFIKGKSIKVSAPYNAYIQTKRADTSNLKTITFDSDTKGYKNFGWSLFDSYDKGFFTILEDIMGNNDVSIAFNRVQDGVDLIVPIDLAVVEDKDSEGKPIIRKSPENIQKFIKCISDITPKEAGIE